MKLSNIVLAVITMATGIQASSLASRQTDVPDANCCVCDYFDEGYKCTVPEGSCGIMPPEACPYTLDAETQTMCCCCDPNPDEPAMKCKAVPKEDGCFCAAVQCPFKWDISFLPAQARP